MRWPAAALCAALFAGCAPAAAQTASPPGPWVVDIRGVTGPVPEDAAFYPPLDTTARVPSRGFGLDAGAHVYFLNLGPARLGAGANVINVRAITRPPEPAPPASPEAPVAPPARGQSLQMDLRLIAPQVSFNFGSRSGWSYLSAGLGTASVVVKTVDVAPGRRDSGRLRALNVGGGARWFLKSHVAFGFDIRFHKIDAGSGGTLEQSGTGVVDPDADPIGPVPTPGKMILTLGVGLGFR